MMHFNRNRLFQPNRLVLGVRRTFFFSKWRNVQGKTCWNINFHLNEFWLPAKVLCACPEKAVNLSDDQFCCYTSQLKYVLRLERYVSRAMGQNFLVRTKLANSLGRTKLTNSPGRTKLNNPLRKQELELYDWLLIGSSTLKQWQISVPASVRQIFFLSLFRLWVEKYNTMT